MGKQPLDNLITNSEFVDIWIIIYSSLAEVYWRLRKFGGEGVLT